MVSAAGKALKMLKEMPFYDGGKSKLDPTSQPFTPGIEYDDLKSPISLGPEFILSFSSERPSQVKLGISKYSAVLKFDKQSIFKAL